MHPIPAPESRLSLPWMHQALVHVLLGILLLLAYAAYRPGLSGTFLFDDFVNLDALGRFGRVETWEIFWRYITSGTADPLGRPVSLASFLLDARDWPADPHAFLRTNVLLHLLNGWLLFLLLRSMARFLRGASRSTDATALIATGCWLLHPLFVSTTLYVVQREAMLPATFTLLGLLTYFHGRVRYVRTDGANGLALAFIGVGAATALAMLSKANGILLPALAAVLEACLFRQFLPTSTAAKRRLLWSQAVVLGIPALVVGFYLLRPLFALDVIPTNRSWSIGQRLLTEPRVMLDYLELLAVPRSVSTGLFNDGYLVSRGLFHPWSTLPCLLALCAFTVFSVMARRRHPEFACAGLFFLVGHLLESTSLPLELYFEHRNYLPALLLFWPLAHAITGWKARIAVRSACAAALLLLLAGTTYERASLWGQPKELARIWALSNPGSSRAQAVAAISERQSEGPRASLARLLPLWQRNPSELQYAFNVVDARCATGGIPAIEKQAVGFALGSAKQIDLMTHVWLANAIEAARGHRCGDLRLDDVRAWVDAALKNPAVVTGRHRDQDFEPLLGMLALHRGDADQALSHLDRALKAYPNPDQAARQAILLASNGYYDQALAHLHTYEALGSPMPATGFSMSWLHHRVLEWQGYWPKELQLLKAKIRAEKAGESHP